MTPAAYIARRNQNLSRHKEVVYLGPISAGFMIIITIILLSFIYLTQINKTSVFGAKLDELNRTNNNLRQQQQGLQIEAARLQSIQQIQNSNIAKNMVPVKQVIYIK